MNKSEKHGYKISTRFKGKRTGLRLQLTALILLGIFGISPAHSADAGPNFIPPLAKVCYVNASVKGGSGDGSSWANAYSGASGVQDALSDLATSNCQHIWVAKGVYRPGSNRTDTFQLVNGVTLYGGFSGTEGALIDRDPLANTTVLSGDIGRLDTYTDNVFHVVTGSGTDYTAVLDGFTVAFGYADGSGLHDAGAGLYIYKGNPTFRNITFRDNHAVSGGGAFNWESNANFWGITFDSNTADYGGGVYNNLSDIEMGNATFVNNTAEVNGGAIANNGSFPTLLHLTIAYNHALGTNSFGGGIFNKVSNPQISNTILWGNTTAASKGGDQIYNDGTSTTTIDHSVVEGGFGGTNITTNNPLLGGMVEHGRMQVMSIRHGSSAKDAAGADNCPYADQRGLSRPQGAGCDIGAYEFQDVIYVVPGGRVSGFCESWSFACDLQYVLREAPNMAKQQIWVKAATYKPSAGTDRAASFSIGDGKLIYGGFAGTETSLGQRDYQGNVTTLSGDLNTAAVTDNSYHVVIVDGCHMEQEDNGYVPTTLLDGFRITGGYADGGGDDSNGGGIGSGPIYSSGCAVLNHLTIRNNYAANQGGGVWNGGSGLGLVIKNTTIALNQAASSGGGIFDDPDTSITLSNVFLIQNSASSEGGGMVTQGRASLTDVTFRQNSAVTDGGGLYYQHQEKGVELSRVVFDRNTAERSGGGLYYWGFHKEGPILSEVTFTGNTATGLGGGMRISTGGNSPPQLTGLTFNDNQAEKGGGLYYNGSDMTDGGLDLLSRATFVGNSSTAIGGGMVVGGVQGLMRDLTMKDNTAVNAGKSLYFYDGTLEIENSIFWGSAILNQISNAPEGRNVWLSTGVVKGGYEYGTNIITSDPLLGTLSDNGGFTQTVPLLPGSPAIDQTEICLDTDQRGVERPQGTACDIGAFEYVTEIQLPGEIFGNGFE